MLGGYEFYRKVKGEFGEYLEGICYGRQVVMEGFWLR